jgi:hypothetical protein
MKQKLVLAIAVLICSILAFGEENRKLMKLSIIVEKEGKYFADGPIYVDLVLTNNSSNDIKLPPYPNLAARWYEPFIGSGFVINLKNEIGESFTFGEPLKAPIGFAVMPPPWTLKAGEMWRWTLDIRSILIWNSEAFPKRGDRRFQVGDYEVTISLTDIRTKEEITSAPAKISLIREGETDTAQAEKSFHDTPSFRNTAGFRNWIMESDKFEKTELGNRVLPTFRRMAKALGAVGKVQKGEYDSRILAQLPSEDEWGIWADDIAAARYLKAARTDKEKAKQIRKETESKFPGSRWLLDQIDQDDPYFCWLSPQF